MESADDVELKVDLLPGEVVDGSKPDVRPRLTDADLNARYVKEGVRIVVEQARYPLNQILGMFTDTFEAESGAREYKYKRDPEYQRRHRWDDGRKSRLVESFLMNVPVPPVFLYEYDLARFEVMDGRQRLTALIDFYSNAFALTELQHWPELNGRTYATLPSSIRDGIDRRYLSSIILLNETAATEEQAAFLKKLVFERLNSGGVRLSGQETRNAVYDGPLNDICLRLSRMLELRSMLGTPADDDLVAETDAAVDDTDDLDDAPEEKGSDGVVVTRIGRRMFESMEDVELVLRFFAYRHLAKYPQGLNRISDFLDDFLIRGNRFDDQVLREYEQLFRRNIEFWFGVGGPDAFKVKNSNRHFSKIAYDALMYASSALDDAQITVLSAAKPIVHAAIDDMYLDNAKVFAGRATNTADAHRRNGIALKTLQAALSEVSDARSSK